jgi:hypothetical protein
MIVIIAVHPGFASPSLYTAQEFQRLFTHPECQSSSRTPRSLRYGVCLSSLVASRWSQMAALVRYIITQWGQAPAVASAHSGSMSHVHPAFRLEVSDLFPHHPPRSTLGAHTPSRPLPPIRLSGPYDTAAAIVVGTGRLFANHASSLLPPSLSPGVDAKAH